MSKRVQRVYNVVSPHALEGSELPNWYPDCMWHAIQRSVGHNSTARGGSLVKANMSYGAGTRGKPQQQHDLDASWGFGLCGAENGAA